MKDLLVQAIADIQEDEALTLAARLLDAGAPAKTILDACREAMCIVGDRYERREYFLPELVVSGETLKRIAALIRPEAREAAATEPLARILIGTVAGDIHDIGKEIVAFMLAANEFEVRDLGVDVSASRFVQEVKEARPDILALSGFLTLAYDSMKETVAALSTAGLRDQVKIMIGGAPMDDGVRDYVGADAYGPDAMAAVRIARRFAGGG
ncbi:MAG: cobalamin B12-binding domain-containing protein [Planctomycetes bacterium]|nr:cobalamin B12-binding domain-containing protein [Planctomycetota bacterium]